MVHYYFFIISSSVVLFFWIICIIKVQKKKQLSSEDYPVEKTELEENYLNTVNGIGNIFYGHFRKDQRTYVSYIYYCILFIPLFPKGCYRIEKIKKNIVGDFFDTSKYIIYGKVKWNFWEAISICLIPLSAVIIVIATLAIRSNIDFA